MSTENNKIHIIVNGKPHESIVEPRTLLVNYLRDELSLTGTHIGCDTSVCGACTVLVDGKAVKSCTMFAVQADSSEIVTVEGLKQGEKYHPIQQAFWEKHGLQCGFCTPGMMISAVEILNEKPSPSEEEIRKGLRGNLCRCTGYHNIVEAVKFAAEKMNGGVK